MSLETQSFKFGEFFLDGKEKVLLRDGKTLSITPKAFELLFVLIEKHGQLIEKSELMKAVWADSFVEEGNLTFTISLLRKALGDDANKPRFIETVPKRGYRFIAEVTEGFVENESKVNTAQAFAQPIEKKSADSSIFKKFLLPIFAVLAVGAIFGGFWFARSKNNKSSVPILSATFSSENLSTNGKVYHAVISPDGKNVVYTSGTGNDKQSVWLRELESGNNIELIPPSDDFYAGIALSPDGNFLYFSRRTKFVEEQADIYRVSIFGGVPIKIISQAQGWISISPDGTKISFVRCDRREDEFCSLWIADSMNGENEKKLASRPRPVRIGDNEFAPDGKSIAFAAGQSENQANEFGLMKIDIESGQESEITKEKFFNIKSLAWLPDESGLLLTASRIPNQNFRIWQVSVATGDAQALTKNSETYATLSLDRSANHLVSTQVKPDFHLYLRDLENPSVEKILPDARKVAFAPNGRIIFSSEMSGNNEIWSINADGSEQRQLTNDVADDTAPIAAPDNNSIFFTSNRTGKAQVWRMNIDGSSQKQITDKEGGYPIFVAPNGNWLYYQHGLDRTLWRVSLKDDQEQLVFNERADRFAFSPDGLNFAFAEKQGEENILRIASLADGQPIKTFRLEDNKAEFPELAWMPDGKSIIYISANNELQKNILWLQPLDGKTPRQIAASGAGETSETISLAIAPDGKSFAFVQGGWKHDAILLKGLK
ncbi:MAG: winged helix-turn-helix domain-containing protein [Acidobacteriota bacterium]